jgi:replicative DNA helicase
VTFKIIRENKDMTPDSGTHPAVAPEPDEVSLSEGNRRAPRPLTERASLPPFPVEAFPAAVADMVAGVAEATQTDAGMAGSTALAVLAACAGGRVEVEVRRGWREPVSLYIATVAGPGERKSSVQATMSKPLIEAEAHLVQIGRAARLEAETAKAVAVKAADHAKVRAGHALGDEKDQLLAEAVGAAEQAAAIGVPVVPRILADDVTPEAVATLLAEHDGRLGLITAEGGIFDIIAGRYSNGPNLDVWLKGHAGDSIRVDRKGRPPEYVPRPALTLGLMIQPAVLTAIAKNESFRGRGLLARFLYALPPSTVGHRRIGASPVPEAVEQEWHQLVRDLAVTLAGWHDPAILNLDQAAQQLALQIESDIEPQLAPTGDLGHIADWGAKLAGATFRIAGLLHMAQHPADGWRQPIGVETLRAAMQVAKYYRAHALMAFDTMQSDPVVADAEYLLSVIRRQGKPKVSTATIHKAASRSRFPKVTDLTPALTLLQDHGYLSDLPPREHFGPGRIPSPLWEVHPDLLSG